MQRSISLILKTRLKINKKISNERLIENGVPQGSILGLILFTIHRNNLYKLQTIGEIVSFIDDTVIYYEAKTWYSQLISVAVIRKGGGGRRFMGAFYPLGLCLIETITTKRIQLRIEFKQITISSKYFTTSRKETFVNSL